MLVMTGIFMITGSLRTAGNKVKVPGNFLPCQADVLGMAHHVSIGLL